ncbi:AI-2E family transporter [Caldalkalibacillus salinus]|uniref:AI-2E family transporter n=1 Tax=Caldalkalibacillus salinus TaxID=2803787 RepID=UPI001924A1D6
MKIPFSKRWVLITAFIALSLVSVYLALRIAPYLLPVWILLRTVGIPVLASLVIAYLLHPIVRKGQALGMHRTMTILMLYLIVIATIAGTFWYASPLVVQQVQAILRKLPEIERLFFQWFWWVNQHIEQLPDGMHYGIDDAMGQLEDDTRNQIKETITTLKDGIGNLFSLFIIPFLVFYILNDWKMLKKAIFHTIPIRYRRHVLHILRDIDYTLGQYIRGQIIISVFVGVMTFVAYYYIGLSYALSLAIIATIANIIPYFGPFIGIIPALLIALVTNPILIVWVIVLNTVIQIVEGNVLAPYIMGKRLNVHPVTIILVLLAGAEVGGIFGLIFAVPFYMVVKVIVMHVVFRYKRSS